MTPRIIQRETLYKGSFLELERLRIDTDSINYEVFNRPSGRNGVNVLAVTKQRELILVEEFRPAIESSAISLVCGVMHNDESPVEDAKRELLEETGYTSDRVFDLCEKTGGIPASPGVFTERVYTVLMLECQKVAAGGGVVSEQEHLVTHIVPLSELGAFLEKSHAAGKDIFTLHHALGLLYLHHRTLWAELFD